MIWLGPLRARGACSGRSQARDSLTVSPSRSGRAGSASRHEGSWAADSPSTARRLNCSRCELHRRSAGPGNTRCSGNGGPDHTAQAFATGQPLQPSCSPGARPATLRSLKTPRRAGRRAVPALQGKRAAQRTWLRRCSNTLRGRTVPGAQIRGLGHGCDELRVQAGPVRDGWLWNWVCEVVAQLLICGRRAQAGDYSSSVSGCE